MPVIVQAPIHEHDTLNIIVQCCRHVAHAFGQWYVVLTVDEDLYWKLLELKYQEFVILRFGELHTSETYKKTVGKHMESSGLENG